MFDTYYQALVKYAYRFLILTDECEDLVQYVFVGLWEKENETSLKVFLYKTVRNKCYNVIKHNKVRDKYTESVVISFEDDSIIADDNKTLYPLPRSVVNQSNGIIKQNPGYN